MKTLTAIVLALVVLSCGPSKKLPAAPEIAPYFDTTYIKLNQEAKVIRAQKRGGKNLHKKPVTFVGISMFTIYCIFAWRSDRE